MSRASMLIPTPYVLDDIIQPVPLDDLVTYRADYDDFIHLAVAKCNADQPTMIYFPIIQKAKPWELCSSRRSLHHIWCLGLCYADRTFKVYEAVVYQMPPSTNLLFCHFCRVRGSRIIPPMPSGCPFGLIHGIPSSLPPPEAVESWFRALFSGEDCQIPKNRSWLRSMTSQEMEFYLGKVKESQGFDVPSFPYAMNKLLKVVSPKVFARHRAEYDCFLQLTVAKYNANQPEGIWYPRILKANRMMSGASEVHYITFEALDSATGI
ncbi:hypothetical protein CDL15_Pgr027703 [Punica granatum]|uniref:Uncharacterized protein n=1 Tax=Punica granatum TaxID=22663 RepID=A0A218XJM9_PUNGR|nr:hypothetical protein CDL15_Pgr027703 [Punica granatum]